MNKKLTSAILALALLPAAAFAQGGIATSARSSGVDSTSLTPSPVSSLGFNGPGAPIQPPTPASCPTESASWVSELNACSGTVPGTASGMYSQAINVTGGFSGANTYVCTNGAWSVLAGSASCQPNENPTGAGEPQSFEVISTSDSSAPSGGHPIFVVPFDAKTITITLEQITPLQISPLPQLNGCEIWYYDYGALNVNGPPTSVPTFTYFFPVKVENAQGSLLQTLSIGTQTNYWVVGSYGNYSSNGGPCNNSSFYQSFSNTPLSLYDDAGDIGDMSWSPSVTITNVKAFSQLDMSPYMTGSFPAPCSGTNVCAYGPTQKYGNTVNDFTQLFQSQSEIGGAGTVETFEYGFKITATPSATPLPSAVSGKKVRTH